MAAVDPRITPLVETLIASGADSIAVDLLIAIQRGLVEEDSEDELQQAREAVGHLREHNEQRTFRSTREAKVRDLTGDEQIEFAAEYVIERLVRQVEMTDASLENMNKIVNGVDEELPSAKRDPPPIMLRWTDSERNLDRERLEIGRVQLTALREALVDWSITAREKGKSE